MTATIWATTRAAGPPLTRLPISGRIKRFSLTLSAREELYRSFSAAFTPTVAAGAWLSPQWKVRASASRAFRIPNYTDLYYHDPAMWAIPTLRPESAWTYETGVDWVPSARLRGDLTLFERRERDGIDYYRTSATDIWQALNIQNLNFKGWEASLRWTPSLTNTFDFSFTQLHGTQDTIAAGFTKYTFNYPTAAAFSAGRSPRGAISSCARGSARSNAWRVRRMRCGMFMSGSHDTRFTRTCRSATPPTRRTSRFPAWRCPGAPLSAGWNWSSASGEVRGFSHPATRHLGTGGTHAGPG